MICGLCQCNGLVVVQLLCLCQAKNGLRRTWNVSIHHAWWRLLVFWSLSWLAFSLLGLSYLRMSSFSLSKCSVLCHVVLFLVAVRPLLVGQLRWALVPLFCEVPIYVFLRWSRPLPGGDPCWLTSKAALF